ncbi:MAG TPA: EamA family transporter [Myxococcota bacterium]|nr:EamA family transporter [Myxococcota bacterium]
MNHRVEWICIALVAVFWGGYPLVARLSNFGGSLGSFFLVVVSVVPIALATFWDGSWTLPERTQLWPMLIAGVMQGIGLLAFLRLATGKLEASVAIPISDVSMLIVTTIGAIYFFEESLGTQKLAGLALLFLGIWLLRPS